MQIEKMIKGEKDWFDLQIYVDWFNYLYDIKQYYMYVLRICILWSYLC